MENVSQAFNYIHQIEEQASKDGEARYVKGCLNVHAGYTVDPSALKKIVDFQKSQFSGEKIRHDGGKKDITFKKDGIIHMHVHETEHEVVAFEEKYGKSVIQILDEIGALNEKFVAAHCVVMSDEEIETFARRGCNVVSCSRSNLKLGSGIAPVQKMLTAGVNVCLGTDSSASNNTLSMWSEIQTAALVGKLKQDANGNSLSAWSALRMATVNGAKALGIDGDVGSIAKGKLADLQVVRFKRKRGEEGVFDVVSELIYGDGAHIVDVLTRGEFRVRNGELVNEKLVSIEEEKNWVNLIKNFK
eukprot:GDKJ01048998.1.p1 GENE.GDKJ01048998.1~~GDKJ01048998.1.p1  ORF type:complete len:326 (-),score=82.42 GDKJ01048998.1:154-1059(-)